MRSSDTLSGTARLTRAMLGTVTKSDFGAEAQDGAGTPACSTDSANGTVCDDADGGACTYCQQGAGIYCTCIAEDGGRVWQRVGEPRTITGRCARSPLTRSPKPPPIPMHYCIVSPWQLEPPSGRMRLV